MHVTLVVLLTALQATTDVMKLNFVYYNMFETRKASKVIHYLTTKQQTVDKKNKLCEYNSFSLGLL